MKKITLFVCPMALYVLWMISYELHCALITVTLAILTILAIFYSCIRD